jgi:hypothetical protein
MNILYVGSLTSYVAQNDLLILKKMGYNVIFLSTREKEHLDVLYKTIGETITPALLSAFRLKAKVLKQTIRRYKIDLIYAAWGSNQIPWIKIMQQMKLDIPIMYNFLSYPHNVYTWKVLLENWYCKKPIKKLDGRVHATKAMHDYMDRHFNLRKHGLDIIMTPFFSKEYGFRKRLPLLSENDGEPHIVFIGPTSLPWDDIRQDIHKITEEKIHFHMVQTNTLATNNSYLHLFPYFPLKQLTDGALATFMTQFDACIVLFNFKVCSCRDRFYTSLPSRFLFALNAGIPIVMPKGYLPACEEFVNKYHNGFTYKDYRHLKKMLGDNALLKRYTRNAMEKTPDFTYEQNSYKLEELIKAIV